MYYQEMLFYYILYNVDHCHFVPAYQFHFYTLQI